MRLQIDVLGSVRVLVDGVERPITARRPRAVLVCLAVRAGEPVSADRLLEEVWGDRLPETGVRAVAYQIARLRSLLQPDRTGERSLITTTSAGYLLHLDPDDIDAHHVEHLIDQARDALTSDPDHSEQLLVEALGLWRGRPFADLGDEPGVERWTRRLDQLHLTARRTLAETRIALDRAGEAIGELEQMVADDPLDEALTGLLMTALHHTGRTADALHTYDQLRRRLATELGIEPSHHLQQLERQLLGTDAQPRGANGPRPRPIPTAASSFVGRANELTILADWLASARLITVCGFGGLGKTRLAQQLAHTIADRFTDGVWYVDLAPITDPSVLVDTIITAGGLTIPRGGDPLDHLLTHLEPTQTLLVLDNCEHLADAVADSVAQIVDRAPHVHVLATSRIPLGIPAEALFTLHPLDEPASIELLDDRARLTRPGSTFDEPNRDAVHLLIERLGGIPLAIELAAARLAVLTLDQLVDDLDRRLDLLTDSRPGPDHRQRSLTTVIDWSYHLLDPRDRELVRRLSVCLGGFDLDAAHVIGTPEPTSSTLAGTLDHLTHLTHAALVEFDTTQRLPRYRILEPVRHHLAGKLAPDERDDTASAHAHHYATVAAAMFDQWSTDAVAAQGAGDRELGNLRAAMDWAYHHDHPRLGLSIARDGRMYFFATERYRELLHWLRTGLDLVADDDPLTLEAASAACIVAGDLTDPDQQRDAFLRVRRGAASVVDPRLRAELLSAEGSVLLQTDPRAAERLMRAAIEMRSSVPIRAAALLNNRIDQSWFVGELDDGPAIRRGWTELAATMARSDSTGNKIRAGIAACEQRWEDVLRTTESADCGQLMIAASLATLRAEALAALDRHREALSVLASVDRDSFEGNLRILDVLRAATDLRRDEPLAAAERLTALADGINRDGRRLAIGMQVATLLGVAAVDLGRHETAAVLFGHAAAEQRRLDIVLRPSQRPLAEGAIAACRTALGTDRYDELAARGAATEWRDLPRVEPDTP